MRGGSEYWEQACVGPLTARGGRLGVMLRDMVTVHDKRCSDQHGMASHRAVRRMVSLVIRRLLVLAAAGMLIVVHPSLPVVAAQAAQKAPKRGGTVVIAYGSEPSSLAPWRSGDFNAHLIYNALYDSLVDQSETLQIVPGLAEGWRVGADRTVYTFFLRRDVKFHDGEDFNAQAAKWNIDRWANPPKGYIFGISGIKSSEVVDDYTLRVTLERPNNKFLILLASRLRAVLPPKAVKQIGEDFSFMPVGTGPFKFERWVTDSEIVLGRNPSYWRKDNAGTALPYLDQLVFRVLPDNSTRHTALITGEIDFNTAVVAENVSDLKARGRFIIFNRALMGYDALRLLTSKAPLADKRVRQAISWAVDRDAINKAVYFGLGDPGSGLYSPPTPGFDVSFRPYTPRDLNKARRLLAEAGHPNGFAMQMIVASPLFQQLAELLQAQLAQVGIRVTIQSVERGVFLSGIVDRRWESYVDRILGRADPADYYDHLACGAVYNGHDYCNKQVDKMALEDGLAFFSDLRNPRRLQLYRQTEQIVMEDAPLVILGHPPLIFAWKNTVEDTVVHPTGRTFWIWAWRQR